MTTQDAYWYKDAVIYEVHVRAFHDADGDGVGDFRGLTLKLDYLEDLGVTVVWLLPFYPSPLKDDGYDIADYTAVNPSYGRLEDFQAFLAEAHKRGIRVVTELVLNHTSDQHPWFQRARLAPAGSVERDFYVWSDSPEKYAGVRIIFQDFEQSNWTYDPVAKSYFWHRFYSHQPDLNFDAPAVREAFFPILDFWFGMGVDGLRLDAVPYLFEREGTNCENLPETHAFLQSLRKYVDEKYPDRMFLAEANQWPEEAAAYFGQGRGDECHMAFHFPLMPRLFMALHQEDRFPILDVLAQTPALPESCQWCLFLRNHDELTLEMVTDEERDYMYRAYAQERRARINVGIRHRLAPLLRNDRRRIELLNALLFSLPGTPVVYYGDEIGMGDNIYLGDRNGVRTPMQWSADRNAGFGRGNPHKLYLPVNIDPEYHYEAVNVEAQQNNASSLLWWMKRLIALRRRRPAFGRGSIEFLRPENSKVLAFVRKHGDEQILVLANLSRFAQQVELDLRAQKGLALEELFGRTQFPRIGDGPTSFTLGPHGFYWFALQAPQAIAVGEANPDGAQDLPELFPEGDWLDWIRGAGRDDLESVLLEYRARRTSRQDARELLAVQLLKVLPLPTDGVRMALLLVQCEIREGGPETLALATTAVGAERAAELLSPLGVACVARLRCEPPLLLCDALAVPECAAAILQAMLAGATFADDGVQIAATVVPGARPAPFDAAAFAQEGNRPVLRRSARNTHTLVFGDRWVLKTSRRVEEGVNPDWEVGRFLTTRADYQGAPPVTAHLEYRPSGAEPASLAVLREYVPNQGDAWQYTLDHLGLYFERVAALSREAPPQPPAAGPLLAPFDEAPPRDDWQELAGGYEGAARLMGRRTAHLHRALASERRDPAFAPEPFTLHYQRSLYQTMRTLAGRLVRRLLHEAPDLPEALRPHAETLCRSYDALLARFQPLMKGELTGFRIRCHGDFHLAQMLYTGKDFVVVDFEGDAARPLGERRVKRSPIRDAASFVQSFDYAVKSVLWGLTDGGGSSTGVVRPADRAALEPWAAAWFHRVARSYLAAYFETMSGAGLLPQSAAEQRMLLDVFLLEKILREIDFDLSRRPAWAVVPLQAAVRLLECAPTLSNLCVL